MKYSEKELQALREQIEATRTEHHILMAAVHAINGMGEFGASFDARLQNATWEQWQYERGRRAALAVIDVMIEMSGKQTTK